MHRWYVKARYQTDHEERADALKCDYIIEDTSEQVDRTSPLPHVLIQARRWEGDLYGTQNYVYVEPTTLELLDSVEPDEPPPPPNDG